MNVTPPQIPAQPTPLQNGLPNFAAALGGTNAVKIVALGSSTTEGEGGIVAYPYRLEVGLRQEYRSRHQDQRRLIDVLNRGIGAQEAPKERLRMQSDAIAEKPQLVIWQIGTNSVWQGAEDAPPSQ